MGIPDPGVPLEQQPHHDTAGLHRGLTDEPDPPFWRPSARELFRHLGWHNLLFLPALATLGLFVAMLFYPALVGIVLQFGIKAVVLALSIPVALAAYAVRLGVQARQDPFCIHCGYSLVTLPPVYRCPECGRPYDVSLCDEYRRDPAWFIQRFREMRRPPPPSVAVDVPDNTPRRRSGDGT